MGSRHLSAKRLALILVCASLGCGSKSHTFVDINNTDMVAALAGDGSSLALVVRNGEASEDLVALSAITVKDWSFTATVPAFSVTTFVLPLSP